MIEAITSSEAIKAIGEDSARAVFYCLMFRAKPSGHTLTSAAELASVIGVDESKAILEELMSY
jgi:hypothetical protein